MSNPTSGWLIELTRLSAKLRERETLKVEKREPVRPPQFTPDEKRQTIVGGKLPYDPVNKQAAMLLCRGSDDWLSMPPAPAPKFEREETPKRKCKKKGKKTMSQKMNTMARVPCQDESVAGVGEVAIFGDYEIKGVRGANGELLFRVEDMQKVLMAMAKDLPDKAIPILERAKDSRASVNELLDGLGHDMTAFEDGCKKFLEDIRQTRMAVVAETSQMSKSLREVRQFFLGGDYQNEIARLREFVDLCERLQALKKDGTLDALADTMIKLA